MKPTDPHCPLRPERVLETSLYVDDLEAAEAFYTRVLGLAVHAKESGRHLFFRCGDQMLLLFNPAQTITESDAAPHGAHGPGHLAFATPMAGLEDWKSRLLAMNVPIEKEMLWPNGGRSMYFRDPAGNSLEFATPRLWDLPEQSRTEKE